MPAPAPFLQKAERKAFDQEHKRKLRFNIGQYNNTVEQGKVQWADLELARRQAKQVKWKAIQNLDKHLLQFEARFTERGGEVVWAENADEALAAIGRIAAEEQVRKVVKSKSMATEEIHLNDYLEERGVEVHETDLGEYIQQLDGEPPYHIVTPAMHKSREDVAQLFHKKLGTDPELSARELTLVARKVLRDQYVTADMGISGANFILAETGSVAVTENEGNARLSTGFPRVHVVLVGIEKVLPQLRDLGLFWPLLASYGTGQWMTVYNSVFSGPRQEGEKDGPERMVVVLLDNGRSKLLAEKEQRESLYCIRCGACLNACPVYRNIGGHTYDTTYSGPIGSVITPHLSGMEDYRHLSQASSLCGRCTEVCPVRIPIHDLLLINRRDAVESGFKDWQEGWTWTAWKTGMLSRGRMDALGAGPKNKALQWFFGRAWGRRRKLPEVESSFAKQWKRGRRQ